MLLKETITDVIHHQSQLVKKQATGIPRDVLGNLKLSSAFILIITGIRRSGKSTFLKQILNAKLKKGLFLNLEDPRLSGFELSDFVRLDAVTRDGFYSAYAFDEIQNVLEWESYVRTKHDEGNIIIVTGSNASLLSMEFGTKLTGRHLSQEIFPFSFNEFLKITKATASCISFTEYMDSGGFPEYLKNRNEEILIRLMDDVIYRDISIRYGIRHHQILRQIAIYLTSNSGKLYSMNGLRKIFGVGSVRSISDYIGYFENSYLLFSVSKFSFSLKKQLINQKKIYSVDTGLAGINSLSFSQDLGRKLETAVYLHFRRKSRKVYYYSENGECDFILTDKGRPVTAIQVCYKLTQDNLDREIKGLKSAMQELNIIDGLIITLDQEDVIEIDKIPVKVIPAWKFLA